MKEQKGGKKIIFPILPLGKISQIIPLNVLTPKIPKIGHNLKYTIDRYLFLNYVTEYESARVSKIVRFRI